jgi:hypothetical protein
VAKLVRDRKAIALDAHERSNADHELARAIHDERPIDRVQALERREIFDRATKATDQRLDAIARHEVALGREGLGNLEHGCLGLAGRLWSRKVDRGVATHRHSTSLPPSILVGNRPLVKAAVVSSLMAQLLN